MSPADADPTATTGPTPGRRPLGVIFDMDGVLVLSTPLLFEAAVAMFAERGVAVEPEEFRPFLGMGEDRMIRGVAEARGLPFDLERDKGRTYDLYLERIRGRLRPLPGATRFVGGCRAQGLRLALASSADAVKVEANLREIGLAPSAFDAIVDGTMVASRKPAPDLFLLAAARLGLDPADCLVVEDAVAGVAAARAAGARCLAVTTTSPAAALIGAGAEWIAPDLSDPPAAALAW